MATFEGNEMQDGYEATCILEARVKCLLTHRCEKETHFIIEQIRPVFECEGIDLLVDPFRPLDHLATRIRSVGFEALVFLLTEEALGSAACRDELDAAREARLPISTIRISGQVPPSLRERLYVDAEQDEGTLISEQLSELATGIRERVLIRRKIECLKGALAPTVAQGLARSLTLHHDCTALSELVEEIGLCYREVGDPTVRHWLAAAIGRSRAPNAATLLTRLLVEPHPYARHAVMQALCGLPRDVVLKALSEHTAREGSELASLAGELLRELRER